MTLPTPAFTSVSASHHSSSTLSTLPTLSASHIRFSAAVVINGTTTKLSLKPRIKLTTKSRPSSRLKAS